MKKCYSLFVHIAPFFSIEKVLAKKSLQIVLIICLSFLLRRELVAQTQYYIRTDTVLAGNKVFGGLNSVRMWTTNLDGTAPDATYFPSNFSSPNQVFNVNHTGYSNAVSWSITGTDSKLVVGYADSVITFITSTNSSLNALVDVLNNATFGTQISNGAFKFGNLAVGSTVKYGGNGPTAQFIQAGQYYNLSLSSLGFTEQPYILPKDGTVSVAGKYTFSGSIDPNGSTIEFNGTGGQVVNGGNYYNLKFSGNKSIPDTIKGTVTIDGNLSAINTGATVNVVKGSTVNFNGVLPQSYGDLSLSNIGNNSGFPHFVTGINYLDSTITMFSSSSDYIVGNKILSPSNIYISPNTAITSVNGTVLKLSAPAMVQVLVYRAGHSPTVIPDTAYYIAVGSVAHTIKMNAIPTFNVGDTLQGFHIGGYGNNNAKSNVTKIVRDTVYIAATINGNQFGNVSIGTANGLPSDKTVFGTLTVSGKFNQNGANFNMGNSTVIYTGSKQAILRSNAANFAYNNLVINQSDGSAATTSGLTPVNGNLSILNGYIKSGKGQDIVFGSSATVSTASDTNFIVGPIQKQFTSTNSFTFPTGYIYGSNKIFRPVVITPQTATPKSYEAQLAAAFQQGNIAPSIVQYIDSLSFIVNQTAGTDSLATIGLGYDFTPKNITSNLLAFAGHTTSDALWHSIGGTIAVNAINNSKGIITTGDYINPTTYGHLAIGLTISLINKKQFYIRTDTLDILQNPVYANVGNVRMWTTNVDGTVNSDTCYPKNFTTANQVFNVNHTGYSNNGVWTISGTGSKLVVGFADSVITFTTGTYSTFNATVDVLNNATFVTRMPKASFKLGGLYPGSTVQFGGSAQGLQNIIPGQYYNLTIATAAFTEFGFVYPKGGLISVAGNFSQSSVIETNDCSFDFNGNGGHTINGGTFYNVTFSGNKSIADTLKGNIYIGGALNLNNTGTPIFHSGGWVNFNGVYPQTYGNIALTNINNLFGFGHTVIGFNHKNSTLIMAGTSKDFAVGNLIASAYGFYFPANTKITEVIGGDTLKLSNPPMVRVLIHYKNHVNGEIPDTAYYIQYGATSKNLVMSAPPIFAVGDTLEGYHVGGYGNTNARSVITAISADTVTIGVSGANSTFFNSVSIGSPSGFPSDKKIVGTLTVGGNFWEAGGTKFDMTGSTVIYTGNPSILRSSEPSFSYNNLTINTTNNGNVYMTGLTPVSGNFSMLSGILAGSAGKEIVLGPDATAFAGDSSFITGPIQKQFSSNNTFTFPTGYVYGKKKIYRPILITPQTATPKTYEVQLGAVYKKKAISAPLIYVDSLTFNVANISGSDNLAQIGVNYDFSPSPILSTALNLSGFTVSDSLWHIIGKSSNSLVTFSKGTLTNDAFVNPSDYSYFTVGLTDTTLLPIKLVSFSGKATANGNVISWTTGSELNTSKFTVEKETIDGSFKAIGTVLAKGNSNIKSTYSFVDDNLSAETSKSFYRLKEVDIDGSVIYSSVISVERSNDFKTVSVAIYPNPTTQYLNVRIETEKEEKFNLSISNSLGQTVMFAQKNMLKGENINRIDVSKLQSGTYFLKVSNSVSSHIERVVIK